MSEYYDNLDKQLEATYGGGTGLRQDGIKVEYEDVVDASGLKIRRTKAPARSWESEAIEDARGPSYEKKCGKWFQQAYAAIYSAGGDPRSVIDRMDENLLRILINNDLHIVYVKSEK